MKATFRMNATRSTSSFLALAAMAASCMPVFAQAPTQPQAGAAPAQHYQLAPMFDTASIDTKADPCTDFYKFACGNFAANHPIPGDQSGVDEFYLVYNVNTQRLNEILTKYAVNDPSRTPNQQKIGDYYAACMNTTLINSKGLESIQPLLTEIDKVNKAGLPHLTGELQRLGVNAFFGFGEQQDFKDASKQIAVVDQGGLGLPERDYYTRTGDKDKQLRTQYVAYITNMLTLSGETPQQAKLDAQNILVFETKLAEASMTNTDRRDPAKIYHPQTLADFEASIKPIDIKPFLQAVHAPSSLPGPLGPESVVDQNPSFFPALVAAVKETDIQTLRAYLRVKLLETFRTELPKNIDDEGFRFFGTILYGQPEQRPRWKRCSTSVDGALGEALGHVYVDQYFAGDSKERTLQMVHDIEAAMDADLDKLDWMSPETKVKAKEKLHLIANKIGYPDNWRDYSKLEISPTDALGNAERAAAFENERQLNKIGKPVDKLEWGMTPPTVNAYYDPSMNNINFPAGILEPAFYDPHADAATNYGHMGAIIGHELTHGFDDQGAQFDGNGNFKDWWSPEDKSKFEAKTACLVNEYGNFTAVDDIKVNGKLTLGENTADNGGLVLAYMAYLDRAKKEGIDTTKKIDGYTGTQRFYISFAQNWCENSRPEMVRAQVLQDPHSPDHFRANGAIVNQPGFAGAFGCKKGTPMAPASNCRVW